MSPSESFLQEYTVQLILHSRYIIIFLLTIIEGPLIMMVSGFLLRLGYLDFLPTYACLMAGDLVGDIAWYSVGYYLGTPFIRKFGKFFSVNEEQIEIVRRIFHKRKNSILFISKITMGFGFALVTLITAGLVHIPFKRYFTINFFGQFIWTAILIYVGYAFGHVYAQVNDAIGKIFIAGLLLLFFLALIGFGRYLRAKMSNTHTT